MQERYDVLGRHKSDSLHFAASEGMRSEKRAATRRILTSTSSRRIIRMRSSFSM